MATWETKGLPSAAERFKYLYADAELDELAGHVGNLARSAGQVHVLFNKNQGNYAQRNAHDLMERLRN